MSRGFIRLQNRTAVVHPQSEGKYHQNNLPTKRNKEKYGTEKKNEQIEWVDEEENIPSSTAPPYNPYMTQVRRVEKRIITMEAKVRKDNSPCIQDLLQMRTVMLKENEIELKRNQRRKKQNEIISKLEDTLGRGGFGLVDEVDIIEDETEEMVDYDDDNQLNAEFKERSIFIKERKYVAGRCTARLHQPMTKFQIYRLAIRVYWTLSSTRDRPVSQILPWMFLGSKTQAANLRYLLDNGFTHILNVTEEVRALLFSRTFHLS
jgi:hypothetical protein